jgi:outer membrane protein TolC
MNGRLRFFLTLPATAAALWLAGCRTAPAPRAADTPWTPPADALRADPLWAAIRSQAPDLSRPQSLPDLVDLALRNNAASRQAWHEARAAAAQVEQARGYLLPSLTGSATATRRRLDATPDSLSRNTLQYGPGLQMNYLLLNFGGGRKAAIEQALQTVYSANFAFNRTLQDILLAVVTRYHGVVSAQAAVEASDAGVTDTAKALETAGARLKAGLGTDLEVLQARAANDRARFDRAAAEGQLKTARAVLALAIGVPADQPVTLVAPTNDLPAALPAQDLKRMIDTALQGRPDIAALRAALAARQANVKVIGAPAWPSLYLNGGVSHTAFEYYGAKPEAAAGAEDNDWTYSGGLSLQWTLFDGLQTVNAKRAAREQVAALRDQLQQAELAAAAEVWTRYAAYETALQKFRFSTALLDSASAAHTLAQRSYAAGLSGILDLLAAETQLAQGRLQHVAARQDVFSALAHLAHATGLMATDGTDRIHDRFSTPTRKEGQL